MEKIRYICPACKTRLTRLREDYRCRKCSMEYPVILGIPDFRLFKSDVEKEKRHIRKIMERFEDCSFEELIKYHFSQYNLPSDLFHIYVKNELDNSKRGRNRIFVVNNLLNSINQDFASKDIALDIGCGTGSGISGMASNFKWTVGVDIALNDLIMAKKFLQENHITNVTLVCASAEELPFEDNLFDLINATDVIEHIPHQEKGLKEVKRVMSYQGFFCFNSPNRYNIFGPEPHVNLWGVGFVPRRYMNYYVKYIKGREYRGIKLLSYFELSNILRGVFGDSYSIQGIIVDRTNLPGSLKGRVVNKFPVTLTLANHFLKYFLTQYQVIAYKTPISGERSGSSCISDEFYQAANQE